MKSIYVEINHKCNLQCITCYNSSFRLDDEMTVSDFNSILKQMNVSSYEYDLIISGGEPFLHSQFFDILACIDNYTAFKTTTIVTNGTLLERFMEDYPDYKRYRFQISLDGYRADGLIRGDTHFALTTKAIRQLNAMCYTQGILHMVINHLNIKDIEDFFEFSIQHHFLPTFTFAMANGNAKEHWDELKFTTYEKYKAISTIEKECKKNASIINEYWPEVDLSKLVNKYTYACPLEKNEEIENILIKTNGSIQPCHALYDDLFSLGNIKNGHIMDDVLPTNPKFQGIQKIISARSQLLENGQCEKCFIKKECHGGCPALGQDAFGSYLMPDEDCTLRRMKAGLHVIQEVGV